MKYFSNLADCLLAIVLAGFWSLLGRQDDELTQRSLVAITVPSTCPITQPPPEEFVPPAPYPTKAPSNSFWLGSEKLWTSRSKDGIWIGYWTSDSDSGTKRKVYFDKVFWWRRGYDWRTENPPKLKVSGRRLDAPSAPFTSTTPMQLS